MINNIDNEDVTNHTEEVNYDAKIIKTSISENDNINNDVYEDEYDAKIIKSENDKGDNEDVTNHTEEEDTSWENRNDTLTSPGFKASSSLVSLSIILG